MRSKTLVIGLGNILLSDEGLGVHAVNALRERYAFRPQIALLDGGTLGLDLLPYLEGRSRVLFIDAVDAGEVPGSIVTLDGDRVGHASGPRLSVHHAGLGDLLFAARMQGICPDEVCLVGMQPASMAPGLELSATARMGMDALLAELVHRLAGWRIEVTEKSQIRSTKS
jgi:hydrogenase maturation protease